VGAAFTIYCMWPALMSWQVTAAITGAANLSHSLRWVWACLRDQLCFHREPSADRFQAARHRSPSNRARYTVIPKSSSITGRSPLREISRTVPPASARLLAARAVRARGCLGCADRSGGSVSGLTGRQLWGFCGDLEDSGLA
jgi:hypothetical protein